MSDITLEALRHLPLELRAQIEENVVRKDLTQTEIAEIQETIRQIIAQQHKPGRPEKEPDAAPPSGEKLGKALPNLRGKTDDIVGAMFGESGYTVQKRRAVVQAVQEDPDAFGDLPELMDRAGKVDGAHQKLRIRRARKERARIRRMRPSPGPVPLLIVGDAECLGLPDECVDLIITSPPYNLGNEDWGGVWERKNGMGYPDERLEGEYQRWQLRILQELFRVATPGASLFYNIKVRQRKGGFIHPLDWLRRPENPWVLRQELIWDRLSTHCHPETLFWQHDERIFWMTKGEPTLPDHSIGMCTVWQFSGPGPNAPRPGTFPPKLPRRCLKAVGRPGIVVLDPFGGSMTTCAVAQAFGYKSIGVDIDPEYVERAKAEHGWAVKRSVVGEDISALEPPVAAIMTASLRLSARIRLTA